jgi:CheY-like chemotaxis protein
MATPSVVIIEQDPEYLEPLDKLLRERGVSVWTAREGKDGLQIIVDHPPDLIILAVKLPNVSGYKICKKLKTHTRFQDTPLFLLASPEERDTLDLHRKLKTRAEEYFVKPFSPRALRDKALEYLFGVQQEEDPLLYFPEPSSLEGALLEDEELAPRSVMPLPPPQHLEAFDEEPEVEVEPPPPQARSWGGDGFRSFEGARHLAVTSPRVVAPPPTFIPAPPAPAPHPFEDLPLDDMLEALDAQRSTPSEDEPDFDPAPLSTPPPFPAPLSNMTMMGAPAFIEPVQDLASSGAYPQLSRSTPREDPDAPPKRGAPDSASDGEGLAARLQRRDQQLKELREKQEQLYSENLTLQETLAQARRELLDAEQHRARRGLELERLRDQLERAQEEQQDQESDRASLQSACAQLQRDLEQARAGQQGLADKLTATRDELTATQDKLTSTQDGLTSTQDGLTSTQEELTAARDELAAARDELAAARDELAAARDELASTRDELAAARDERVRLQQELHLARQRNIDARQAQEEAQDQAEELEEELRQARQAAQALAQERERLQQELSEAQRVVSEGEQQRATESDQLTRLKGALQHAREHLRAVISKAESDMKELREEYVKARQQWKQEQAIMAEEQRRLSDLVKDLEGRADDLYRQLDDKTQEYDLLREEHQDLWKTLQASEEDVGRLTRDLEQARQELQQARLQYQELELAKQQQEERAHKLSQEAQGREAHLNKVFGLNQDHISTLERALEETERSHQVTRANLQKATAYASGLEERLRNVGEAFGKLGQLLAASSENLVASKDFLSMPSLPSYSSIPALPARPARPALPEPPAPAQEEAHAEEQAEQQGEPLALAGVAEEPAEGQEAAAEAAPPEAEAAPLEAEAAPLEAEAAPLEAVVVDGDQTKLGAEAIPPEAIGPGAEEKAGNPPSLSISLEDEQEDDPFADLAQDLVDDLESSADFEMEMRRISAPPKAESGPEELDAIPLAVSPLEQGSSSSIANMQQHDDPTFFSEKGPTTPPAGRGEDDMLLDLEGDDELPLMEEGEQAALGEEMIELDDDAPLP